MSLLTNKINTSGPMGPWVEFTVYNSYCGIEITRVWVGLLYVLSL